MRYEFKGTPGEWHVFDHHLGCGVSDGFSDVAHCHGFNDKRFREEERANAQLIAAAPDLLAACGKVANLNPEAGEIGEGMLRSIISEARAALAKATGDKA